MTTGLSQLTLDTLHAFAARRRMLIAVRGLCVGIVSLLIVMSLIAIVDALFVIKSQPLRWTLSLTGYALVAIVIWLTSLRSLLRIPGSRELARLIEQRAPGLREDLISAVELGSANSDARFDSPVFRSLLQASVERRLGGVEVQSLLPAGLIRGTAFLATAALLICVALLLVPDLHFASRLTRAFLPSAPIDRVSSVQVLVLAPNPADALVPHNDAVQVLVELRGQETEDVTIETFRTGEGHQREEIVLKPAPGSRQYVGTIQLGRESVQYRVLAGDAVTRLFTIDTAARPHVVAFAKTYLPPDYADLPTQTVRENHGHLQGIEGTHVDLILDLAEPIASGEIRFDEADGVHAPIALDRIADQQWRAHVPIAKSTTYKVHLVAAKTGFDNAFDPPYEITSTPDAPPAVVVQSPGRDMLLPPAQPLQVKLEASDDLGLASVSQWFRVNGGPWNELSLARNPGQKWSDDRAWDVYDLSLRAGDQLTMKFSASDRAGSKTETAPVNITIAASGFDANRLSHIEAKRELLAAITVLRTSVEQHAKIADQEADDAPATGELQRKQIAMNAFEAARAVEESADAAWGIALRAIKTNSQGAAGHELSQIARMLSQIRDQLMSVSKANLEKALAADSPSMLAAVMASPQSFAAAAAIATQAQSTLAYVLASDEADALLRDLLTLRREQAAITADHLPDEPATWQGLARRQLLLAVQMKQAESLAQAMSHGDAKHGELLLKLRESFAAQRQSVEKSLAKVATKASTNDARAKTTATIESAIADLLPLARARATLAAREHRSLRAADRMLFHAAANLAAEPSQNQRIVLADESRWIASEVSLKAAGTIEESRSDGQALLAADMALYRRAVLAIRDRLATESSDQIRARLSRIAGAFRTLETGHELTAAQMLAASLAAREKWLRSQGDAVTHHARDWAAVQAWLPGMTERMKEASLPTDAVDMVSGVLRSSAALILDVEMNSRRVKGQIAQKRLAQFDHIAVLLANASVKIRSVMVAARAILAAEVPTLSEQMAALAREARTLQNKAQNASQKLDTPEAPPLEREPNELAAGQKALDAKLGELLEMLRHDANAQDVFSHDGRERARDADDAAAMVREPAAKAMAAASEAAKADDSSEQQSSLNEAAGQDEKLAKTLDQLAEHYEKLEAGNGEETRSALRQAEQELGIKRDMDAQFGRMERLADLAQRSPEEQAAQLERELKQNPAMQKELSDIARDAAAGAQESLEEAAAQQRRVEQDLAAAKQAEQQAKPDVAGQMNDLARKAGELAKKVPSIEQNATKGTAKEAASAAAKAGQALLKAAGVSPPSDAKDHKAAAAQAAALADSLKNASDQLKAAGQQAAAAAERVRDAEGKATAALSVGNASQEERLDAADTLLHAKPRQDAAKRAAADALAAAKQAGEMADAAAKIAKEVSAAANAGEEAIEKGLQQQPAIAAAVAKAGEELGRAARHEDRMERDEAARALEQSKDRTQREAAKAIGEATEKLAQAKQPGDAQGAVGQAEKTIAGEASKVEQLLKDEQSRKRSEESRSQRNDDQAARDQEAAQWMARALDELDRSMHDKGDKPPALALSPQAQKRLAEADAKSGEQNSPDGKQPGEQGAPSAQGGPGKSMEQTQSNPAAGEQASQAMREAAAAQQRAMAQARQPDGVPGQESGQPMAANPKNSKPSGSAQGGEGEPAGGEGESKQMASGQGKPSDAKGKGTGGTGSRGNAAESGELPSLPALRPGDWGKLPARLAKELMEGQRDEIPTEYRSQVEAYFRAIAQKAKSK